MKYLLGFLLVMFISPAFAADPVDGFWLTQNERAVIQLEECDQGLCGSIYWIIDGGLQYDENNPDEALRADPMCGLQIVYGFEHDEPGKWTSGKIYKADEGDIYDAKISLEDANTLKLRGYIGTPLLGKTQKWTRVDKAEYKACTPPA